jgi:hypothetical protein
MDKYVLIEHNNRILVMLSRDVAAEIWDKAVCSVGMFDVATAMTVQRACNKAYARGVVTGVDSISPGSVVR